MSSQPGVLDVLTDGHINQGGEVEQRKSFVKQAGSLAFGLELVTGGMVTFGSAVSPGGFPSNVTYQRLQHPDGATAMTAILHSASFNGKAAAIAEFADGTVFAYYDGAIISDNIAGVILPYMTTATAGNNNLISAHLTALVNAASFASSSSSSNVSTLTMPSGASVNLVENKTTAAGAITIQDDFQSHVDGIDGVQSQGQFTVKAGDKTAYATTHRARTTNVATLTIGAHNFLATDVVDITGFSGGAAGYNATAVALTAVGATTISYANTGSDEGTTADVTGSVSLTAKVTSIKVATTELLSAAVNYSSSVEVTASALKDAINSGPANATYEATVDGATVFIRAVAVGTTANNKAVSVTVVGAICIGSYSSAITMTSGATTTMPTLSYVYVNGVDVLGGAIAGAASLEAIATKAATQIRAAGVYAAVAVGNVINLSRLITSSSDNELAVMVITSATGGVATTPTDQVIVSLGPEGTTFFGPSGAIGLSKFTSGSTLTVQAQGGNAPYSYRWTIEGPNGNAGDFVTGAPSQANGTLKVEFLPSNTSIGPQLKFTRATLRGFSETSFSGYVACTVTDNVGRSATEYLQIDVSFYPYA